MCVEPRIDWGLLSTKLSQFGDGIEADRANDLSGTTLPQGTVGFVRLALVIYSVVPNTAAVERIFSQFGIVRSKLRNRLRPETAHKAVVVRSDLAKTSNFKRRKSDTLAHNQASDSSDDDDVGSSQAMLSSSVALPAPQPDISKTILRLVLRATFVTFWA